MWWLSACLVLGWLAGTIESRWVNFTVHSTDPRISYAPESCCRGKCGVQFEPWEVATYNAFDNRRYSFYQADSWGNEPSSEILKRRFSFRFSGSAVYIYGAPRDQIKYPPGKQEVCLDGNCEVIDGGKKYDPARIEPVLLWSSGDLGSVRPHLVELRFLDNGNGKWWWPMTSASLHHLVYTADPAFEPMPYTPVNGTEAANVTLHDTNYAIKYEPREAWNRSTFSALSKPKDTFHHSSNEGNFPNNGSSHQVTFELQGAALYVYGASEDALLTLDPKPYLHAPIDVCLNDECHPVDVHQAYLDAIDGPHAPVLLWSHSGLSPNKTTFVHIRMLAGESPAGVLRRATFEKVVYTEVRSKSPVAHPVPRGIYHEETVLHDSVDRFPLMRWRTESSASGPYGSVLNDKWHGAMPQWSYSARGHSFKIYGPPLESMKNVEHAAQQICLDHTYCHYVDVGHIYLSIPDSYKRLPVLIWSVDAIDPFTNHTITSEMVDHFYDHETRVMALSHVDALRVEVPPPPKPTTSSTPAKTASPTLPSTAAPTTTTVFVTLAPVLKPEHGIGYHFFLLFTGAAICAVALVVGPVLYRHWDRVQHYMPLNGTPHPGYGAVETESNVSEEETPRL